jgi:hypothetical protein
MTTSVLTGYSPSFSILGLLALIAKTWHDENMKISAAVLGKSISLSIDI